MNKTLQTVIAVVAFVAASQAEAQVANVTPTEVSASGVNLTTGLASAPGTSLYLSNDGNNSLVIKTGSTAISATVRSNGSQACPAGFGCFSLPDVAVNVPANSYVEMGSFPKNRFNIPGFDTVKVDITSTTLVSVTNLHESNQ